MSVGIMQCMCEICVSFSGIFFQNPRDSTSATIFALLDKCSMVAFGKSAAMVSNKLRIANALDF